MGSRLMARHQPTSRAEGDVWNRHRRQVNGLRQRRGGSAISGQRQHETEVGRHVVGGSEISDTGGTGNEELAVNCCGSRR